MVWQSCEQGGFFVECFQMVDEFQLRRSDRTGTEMVKSIKFGDLPKRFDIVEREAHWRKRWGSARLMWRRALPRRH